MMDLASRVGLLYMPIFRASLLVAHVSNDIPVLQHPRQLVGA